MTESLTDPIARFTEWFAAASAHPAIIDATAMCLATATKDGLPSARMVLLKAHDERGFVFYTNFHSRKGSELLANPRATLCFHWAPLERQVRIEGPIQQISDTEADAYFATRPRDSQIGAWASDQSRRLEAPEIFFDRIKDVSLRFEGRPVPRPPHWSGFRLTPSTIEFWQQGEFRLHAREAFTRGSASDAWKVVRLYP